jgi:hypothetical protein
MKKRWWYWLSGYMVGYLAYDFQNHTYVIAVFDIICAISFWKIAERTK